LLRGGNRYLLADGADVNAVIAQHLLQTQPGRLRLGEQDKPAAHQICPLKPWLWPATDHKKAIPIIDLYDAGGGVGKISDTL